VHLQSKYNDRFANIFMDHDLNDSRPMMVGNKARGSQWRMTVDNEAGYMLESTRANLYLHVPEETYQSGLPVVISDPEDDRSTWIIEEASKAESFTWCAPGYDMFEGDIGGIGSVNGRGGGERVNECEECAHLCTKDRDCLSYECSEFKHKCNLNDARERTHFRNYKDYGFCVKACATGYEKVTGDIKGWGEVNGKGDGEWVGSCVNFSPDQWAQIPQCDYQKGCVSCAQMCSDEPDCNSYECSHTELECNLNTKRHPTSQIDNKDFDFCMKNEICASGYEEDVGDVGGWGSINGKGGGQIVTSCEQCGGFCDSYSDCLSYECSLTELKCNLNELREPSGREKFRDYGFCKKE